MSFRCLLVGLDLGDDVVSVDESLDELSQLADSAGGAECARITQARRRPDPATYLGRGKLEEVVAAAEQYEVDVVIFDDELSPAQTRNLERSLDVRVVDRTQLILDIFAQRARTREGKIQVEMAQLRYILP